MSEFKMVEGARNLHVAQIDTKDGKFLAPRRIRGLGEIKVTNTYKEGSAIGDMEVMLQKKKLKQLDTAITVNELPPELEALLQGMTYAKGELRTGKDDNQNPVAILWEEVYSNGSSKYCVIYNIKLARDEKGANGNSDNIDFKTISMSGAGLYSEIAQDFMLELFSDDPDVDKNKIENFFKQVQMPGDMANNNEIATETDIDTTISVEYAAYSSGTVDNISIEGVTFDTDAKKFRKVPKDTTTFTFDVDGTSVTATLSDGTWSFA